jgi:hypothetical protein
MGEMKKVMVSLLMPPCYAHGVVEKHNNDSCNAEGQIGDIVCLVTINTGASVTVARLDIIVELPERDLAMPYILQMASEEILSILKESVSKADFGAVPADNLGVRRQYR